MTSRPGAAIHPEGFIARLISFPWPFSFVCCALTAYHILGEIFTTDKYPSAYLPCVVPFRHRKVESQMQMLCEFVFELLQTCANFPPRSSQKQFTLITTWKQNFLQAILNTRCMMMVKITPGLAAQSGACFVIIPQLSLHYHH